MTSTLLVSLLAAGLAVALARENRIRRALQDLVTRLIAKLRQKPDQEARQHHHQYRRHP